MSNLNVDSIKSSDGTKGPVITGNVVFSGSSHIVLPKGTTAQRPTGVAPGSLRFNTDTKLVEQYNGTDWVTLSSHSPGRAVFGGGRNPVSPSGNGFTNIIDYVNITTTGDAASFGEFYGGYSSNRAYMGSCSSSTRGVFAGGQTAGGVSQNRIDYITIATTGTATDFGDLVTTMYAPAACSSSTRGVFGGGYSGNVLYYITIASTGNALNFGNFSSVGSSSTGVNATCSSSIRGVFAGGYAPATPADISSNRIDYITIATLGNTTSFGQLTQRRQTRSGCSSSTRGIFAGGADNTIGRVNIIDYITIATTGNATDFGDLTAPRTVSSACSSSIRGVFAGGNLNPSADDYESTSPTNVIEYITIASQGTSATDFGDLTLARGFLSACSDAHGGLA